MDDVHAINVAKTKFREGYNSGDIERVLSVFSDALTDMSDGEPSFWGPEAKAVLRHRLMELIATYRATMKVIIGDIRVVGDTAWSWGWHDLTLVPKQGGEEMTRRERYVEIWNKDKQKNWKITLFISSRDLPPAMPPFHWPPEATLAQQSKQLAAHALRRLHVARAARHSPP
jgi:ketosteroid isomerase-like protein